MLRLINRLIRFLGFEVRRRPDSAHARKGGVIASIEPSEKVIGHVLISYIPDYVMADEQDVSAAHTHYWECREMALSYVAEGFAVDVVHFDDTEFIPEKEYDVLVSARTDLERLSRLVPSHCLKIAHLDTAHFLTHNANAAQRLVQIRDRHRVSLRSNRMVEDNWAIEFADLGCVLGNEFTVNTYRFADKSIYRIPLSSVRSYEWDDTKNFDACRDTFLWFGSGGFAHKGLDLVIDAFQLMPELKLMICGPLEQEPRFCKAFNKEMFHTNNIETIGWVDITSESFTELTRRAIATIYPSCSEGGGGSVLTCMHAGLIPVVTREASVDVGDFGLVLDSASVEQIRNAVLRLANAPAEELEMRSRAAWQFARSNHTREFFSRNYKHFVRDIVRPALERKINS